MSGFKARQICQDSQQYSTHVRKEKHVVFWNLILNIIYFLKLIRCDKVLNAIVIATYNIMQQGHLLEAQSL